MIQGIKYINETTMSNKCTHSEYFHFKTFVNLKYFVTNAEHIKEFQGFSIVFLEIIKILFNQNR